MLSCNCNPSGAIMKCKNSLDCAFGIFFKTEGRFSFSKTEICDREIYTVTMKLRKTLSFDYTLGTVIQWLLV